MVVEYVVFIQIFGVGGLYVLFVDFVKKGVFCEYGQGGEVVDYDGQGWQGDVVQVIQCLVLLGQLIKIV